MYVLLVYDIEEKRVARVLKLCRGYLNWVQNSVFEGEISKGKLKEFKMKLNKIINKDKDSILIYRIREASLFKKEIMGRERNPLESIL